MGDVRNEILPHRLHPAQLAGHLIDSFHQLAELAVTLCVLHNYGEISFGNTPNRLQDRDVEGPFPAAADQGEHPADQKHDQESEQHRQKLRDVFGGRRPIMPIKSMHDEVSRRPCTR
ncbi:hypothetical protein D3C71_1617050 [compost metagenome]